MTELTIWQNEAHANYDHERDVRYLVRIPPHPYAPGAEWRIIVPDDEFFTPYYRKSNPTREEACLFAAEYSAAFPHIPVRVERVTLTPETWDHAGAYTQEQCKNLSFVAAEKRLNAQRERLGEQYAVVDFASAWQNMSYSERLEWEKANIPRKDES